MKMEDQQNAINYIRDPEKIYQQSFAIVKGETDLSHFPADQHPLITRLIHACGMPDITDELYLSNNLMTTAQTALDNGAKILCDCEMTAAGIIKRHLPRHTKIITTLNDAATPTLAKQIKNTRSAAAVELWQPHIKGAIIAIGNAPTAPVSPAGIAGGLAGKTRMYSGVSCRLCRRGGKQNRAGE